MGEFHGGLFGLHTLWWLLLFAVVVAALRAILRGREQGSAALSARGILDQRYARGEIDAAEYAGRRRGPKSTDARRNAR
jgi:uncharacterized membrane protein